MQRGKALVNRALTGLPTCAEENFCLIQIIEYKKFCIKRENELTKLKNYDKEEDVYIFSHKGKSSHGFLIMKNKSKCELENQIFILKRFVQIQKKISRYFVRRDETRLDQAQASSTSTVALLRDEGDDTNADIQIPSDAMKDQPGEGTSKIFPPPDTEWLELIPKTTHRRTNNRKAHFCKFCNKKIVYLSRHVKTVHEAEAEVKKYVEATGSYKNRLFAKIMGDGDKKYNREHPQSPIVLKSHKVGSKPQPRISCTSCNNYVSAKNYFTHLKVCNASLRRQSSDHGLPTPEVSDS